jgi:DUF4097 and DUF4098 domain-containing protein YvlB
MRPRGSGSITGPLVLITVGAIFLVHAVSPDFQLADLLAHYWPYLLILWGAIALIEVCVRFAGNRPVPANGISGGAWVFVIFICLAGAAANEMRRPDAWWHNAGFDRGMQAFGEEHEYSVDPVQKSVGAKPRVILESFQGDAKISGGDDGELSLSGHKSIRAFETSQADDANNRTPVEIVQEGNTIFIRCHQDQANSRSRVTTNLELTVPKGSSIQAVGTLGDFDISSITGDVDVSSGNAGVHLQSIGGNVKIETRRSDLIRCSDVEGSVDLRGHGQDVELLKIAGQVTVSGDYTGTVSLRELTKPVRLSSMRTRFDAEQVPGEIRMDRGSLTAQNIVGPVHLTTHSTDVTLDGFTEALDLKVDRGDIELRPQNIPLSKMTVHNASGNIELALPPSAAFALNAITNHGDIDNQFGESLKESSEGRGAKLEGGSGDGPDVSLTTQHGSITVRKATGERAERPEKPEPPERPEKPQKPTRFDDN